MHLSAGLTSVRPPLSPTPPPGGDSRLPGWIPGGLLRLYGQDLARLQRLLDPVLVALLFDAFNQNAVNLTDPFVRVGLQVLVFCLTALVLPLGKIYRSYRQSSLWLLLQRLTFSWAFILGALLLFGFAAKITASFSRLDFSLWALSSWVLLLGSHVGGRRFLRWYRRRGGNSRTIVFWGAPSAAAGLHQQIQAMPHLGLRLMAWFAAPCVAPFVLPAGMPPSCGGLHDLSAWLEHNDCDQILFSDSPDPDLPMSEVIRILGDTCRPVSYLPSWSQPSMSLQVQPLASFSAITLWGGENTPLNRQIKRGFDLLVASTALLLLLPLMLLLCLLVALSGSGPVFFLQDRYGLDGRRFKVFKFRTMIVSDDAARNGLIQARRDDPRVTPLGRILRRWSLDELPQLFNVLRGDMSLVGPRPHAVEHNETYRRLIPGYMQRHLFKPGITGLAQVEGWRGETADLQAMAQRIDADLRYQRDWSLSLDLHILLRTLLQLRSPQAY